MSKMSRIMLCPPTEIIFKLKRDYLNAEKYFIIDYSYFCNKSNINEELIVMMITEIQLN